MSDKNLIIITAPSGAGKTSITHYLLKKFPQLAFSVSATTREQRSYERNGVDYYFVSLDDFRHKIQQNDFIEWEMVYEGKYYGTLRNEIERIWEKEKTPILDIDVKGAIHVIQQFPDHSLSLFVEPPNIDELKRRLMSRGTESDKSLQDRINKASYEISFRDHFDQIIVNDDLDKACRHAEELVSRFLKL